MVGFITKYFNFVVGFITKYFNFVVGFNP